MLAVVFLGATGRSALGQDVPPTSATPQPQLIPVAPYRLDDAVAEGLAWLTPAIQTPQPLTMGVEHIHIADVNRRWAAALPVPTRIPNAIALSPDGEYLAIAGPVGEIKVSGPLRVDFVIVRLPTGKVVHTRPGAGGVTELSWLGMSELLVIEDTARFKVGSPQFALRRLSVPEGVERHVTPLLPGRRIHRCVAEPNGTRVAVVESDGSFFDLHLALVERASGEAIPLRVPKGLVNPASLAWWPDGQALYVEIAGIPWKIPTLADGKAEAVLEGIQDLEGLEVEGSLSPNGELLLAGARKAKTLVLVNLKSRRSQTVGTCGDGAGPLLRQVVWSKSGAVAAGWMGIAQRTNDGSGGSLSWTPFLLNLTTARLATYRGDDRAHPLFLVETPSIIDAIRKDAKAWR